MPKLSIILPIYNVEKYIDTCLASIMKQVDRQVEVICVDDGSTDESGKICDAYANQYGNIIVLHTKNRGVGAARNLGVKIAQGEYIAWCDPDDYVASNWYEGIKKILAYEPDIGVFDYEIFNKKMKKTIKYGVPMGVIDKDQFLYDIVDDIKIQSQLWQKVFKRSLFDGISFPENVKCMEDYAILHKLILVADKIYYLPEALYHYRQRDDGLVKTIDVKKSYTCYQIALQRYLDLKKAHYHVAKIGFLQQAMGVCIQFAKTDARDRENFIDQNRTCRKMIRRNILEIVQTGVSLREKVKFCIIALGCHCYIITSLQKMKGKN